MMKKAMVFAGFLAAMVFWLGSVVCSDAASPWKWMHSLKIERKDIRVKYPAGVYVDKEKKRYYVTDAGSGTIHSYNIKGEHLNSFRPGDSLDQPYAMVRDDKGIMWVVEKGRNSLTRIDLQAKKIEPKILRVDDRVLYPDRIMLHERAFYILDKYAGDIFVFDESLQRIKSFSCDDCRGGFIDFTVKEGAVWGLVKEENSVYRYDLKGKLLGKVQLEKKLAFPYAIEVGSSGLIYILDRHEGTVAVFDQSGKYKYRFLSKGSERGSLYYPEDLLFDPWGRLCVLDAGNGRVEIFSR